MQSVLSVDSTPFSFRARIVDSMPARQFPAKMPLWSMPRAIAFLAQVSLCGVQGFFAPLGFVRGNLSEKKTA